MIAPIKGQTMSSAQAVAMRDRSAFFAEWAMGCGHDGSDLRQEHGQDRCRVKTCTFVCCYDIGGYSIE